MKAVTLQGKSINDIEEKIAEAISESYQPTLAIIFAHVSFDLKKLSEIFQENEIFIFGASALDTIVGEEMLEHSIVVILLDINKNDFALYHEETKDHNTYEISGNAARFAKGKYDNPAFIVVASSVKTDGVSVVEGINDEMKRPVPVLGGMAGGELRETITTYIFTNNKVIEDGLLFLIINSDKIEVKGIATSGWETVGIEKTITRMEGSTVYTIDDKPALDMFLKYYNISEETFENNSMSTLGMQTPLQIIEEGKKPVLRAVMFANKDDRSILFGGRISENAKVKFSILPSFDIIDKTVDEIRSLQTILPETDAVLLFSCGARLNAFGPIMEDEVKGISEIWDAPFAGLFTFGEFGNAMDEESKYHNETCIVAVLKEK